MNKMKQISKSVKKYEELLRNHSEILKRDASLFIDDTEILLAVIRAIEKENEKKFKKYFKKISLQTNPIFLIEILRLKRLSIKLKKIDEEKLEIKNLEERIVEISKKLQQYQYLL